MQKMHAHIFYPYPEKRNKKKRHKPAESITLGPVYLPPICSLNIPKLLLAHKTKKNLSRLKAGLN